jgi:hypothetical protein
MNIGDNQSIPEHATPQGTPRFVVITPSDGANCPAGIRSLHIGGAGVVQAQNESAVTVAFTCVAGQRLDISPRAILATGTTATLIVALMA